MDILVKSFNRAYYLERCLRSIYQFVSGDYTVHILDDGTPPEYLARMQELFPAVRVQRSPRYPDKVAAIRRHLAGGQPFDEFTIPIAFWVEQVRQCSDIFLLLEDDIWVTAPISLADFQRQMVANHLATIKLSWLGNQRLVTGTKQPLDEEIEEVVPVIPLATATVFLNRYRVRSVLFRLGLLRFFKTDFEYQLPLYVLYSVASAFFDKAYWLSLWDDAQTKIDEAQQLRKAADWFARHRPRYAKTRREVTKTSFTTSATNMFAGIDLDVFRFNHHLNEAWRLGQLDAMHDFPRDFSADYLRPFLEAAADPHTTYAEWLRWTEQFKGQYRRIGCEVE